MKPKIVFVTRKMMMGGIEKALISMLRQLPKDKLDITVLTEYSDGELNKEIPSYVKVKNIYGDEKRTMIRLWECLKKGKFTSFFRIIFNTLLLKRKNLTGFDKHVHNAKTRLYDTNEFDIAISYSGPVFLPIVYTATNIKAKHKIAWIHNDVSDLGQSEHVTLVKKIKKYLGLYDHVFCVSHHARRKFNEVFPATAKDVSVFYNIIDTVYLEQLAKVKSYTDNFSGFRMLTVGRLNHAKGQDLIPETLSLLVSKGYNVRWYCIGDGDLREKLESKIQELALEDHFILLGTKENPYSYIKDCDLYIQPSRHEAYCITVAEARVFNKPIITTNTGASEQIKDEQTGLIVNFNVEEMVEAIIKLINNHALRNSLTENLSKESADTKDEMKKLYRFI